MKKMLIVLLCAVALMISGTAYAEGDNSESEATEGAEAVVNGFNDNSTTNVKNRQFVNPGVTPLPHTNGFFTAPTPILINSFLAEKTHSLNTRHKIRVSQLRLIEDQSSKRDEVGVIQVVPQPEDMKPS